MPASDFESRATDLRFYSLVQAITDYAIYAIDPNGVVATWNPGAQAIKGYTQSEIVGQNFSKFFTPEDQASGRPALALATARAAGRFEDDGWRVRKDGSRFWASAVIDPIRAEDGQIVGFAKITRDMSEARAAREALIDSERRFRLLADSVVQYAIFTLDLDGLVTSWNPGAERTKGYGREEIIGQHFSRFFTDADRASGKPARALATARMTGRFEDEGWRVRKNGNRFWASTVIDPIFDETRQIIGFAKVTRDISERRALDEAREQLHQAQKMETLGQLTGGVAHDFNNLLSAVMMSLELIGRSSDPARVRRLVETAQRAAGRGAALTAQLLAFSRRQTLWPRTSDIRELILAIRTLLDGAVSEAIALRMDLEAGLWLADIDHAQFQSALLNLIVNARDAMPAGGTLTIRASNETIDDAGAACLGEIAPGPYVALRVTDTGEGMSPAVAARAIEPFFTTKEVGKGTGLGLSQVYGFARQSNGQIEIRSEPGSGTSVCIYLPKSGNSAVARSDPPAIRDDDRHHGSVLLVEDHPDTLEIANMALLTLGYDVTVAKDGPSALAILKAGAAIDLLFTDIVMPGGMTGTDLAQEASRIRPTLHVLFTSGYPNEALADRDGLGAGVAFIAKPYTLSTLIEKLRTLAPPGAPSRAR